MHNGIDSLEAFPLGRGTASICGTIGIKARWRSGYAPDCKSVYPGSIPGRASNLLTAFSGAGYGAPKPRNSAGFGGVVAV